MNNIMNIPVNKVNRVNRVNKVNISSDKIKPNLFSKIRPYLPYIIAGVSGLIILILLLIYIFSPEDKKIEDKKDTDQTQTPPTPTPPGPSSRPSPRSSPPSRPSTSAKFVGNKSLDKIYTDAEGNKVLSNAMLTSNINLSTDKYSCSFIVKYKGNNERSVECTSGCTGDDENSTFCKKYTYPGGDSSLKDTFLDETYIGRRRGRRG